ncbi:MAG TPA: NADH dehydrogenase subunit [Thermoplasmata archaeon]|mgnify:CR=1 FL=1|nr:NADH dehydrogenase subunit [Thermoplasmata archaeon]
MAEKSCTYSLPIGPIHPALHEPFLFQFQIDGERIKKVDLIGGKVHRGIEWMGMRRNPIQVIYVAERICGICSCSHAFTYCRAVEDAADIDVPERAQYIRAIIAELERMHSHLLWAGVAAHEIGFDSLLYYTWRAREGVMDLLELISGNRVNYGMLMIGGVRRDLSDETLSKIKDAMDRFDPVADKLIYLFLEDKTVKLRTQDVGILSFNDAIKLCALGPTARASGVRKDVRQDQPYCAYADLEIRAITPENFDKETVGDVYDKTLVRLLEVKQSIGIIKQCVDSLPSGDLLAEPKLVKILATLKKVNNEGLGRVEAPRGELVHWVRLQESTNLRAWKARSPTYNNVLPWQPMLIGEQIADIPIVAASTDPCFSCLDRAVVTKNGKSEIITGEELHRLSLEKTRRLKKWG